MNEEIRINEISDDALENVSGGAGRKRDGVCALCGANAYNKATDRGIRLVCSACGHVDACSVVPR